MMTSSENIIEQIKLVSDVNEFQLSQYEVYDESCGTIYLTFQGLLIFHCTRCPAIYEQLQQYRAHLKLKHYPSINFKDLQSNDNGDDEFEVAFAPTATLQPEEETEAIDPVALPTTDNMLLLKKEQEEQYIASSAEIKLESMTDWQEEPSHMELIVAAKEQQQAQEIEQNHEQEQEPEQLIETSFIKIEPMPDDFSLEFQENDIVNTITSEKATEEKVLELENTKLEHLCTCCGETFKEENELSHHMTLQHSASTSNSSESTGDLSKKLQKIFKCDKCEKVFHTKKGINKHKIVHTEPRFKCPLCGKAFKDRSNCNAHIRRHELKRKYPFIIESQQINVTDTNATSSNAANAQLCKRLCPYCGATFKEDAELSNHMAQQHSQGHERVCKICGKFFSTKLTLERHLREHHIERGDICEQATTKIELLNTHVCASEKCMHFNCEICKKVMYTKRGFRRHLMRHEMKQGQRPCPRKTVKSTSSHTSESVADFSQQLPQIYKCDKCDKVFNSKKSIAKHKIVHTEPRFKCPICGNAFKDRSNCNAHIRRHGSERRYSCPDCPKKYLMSSDLVLHRRTHTGEKPYICSTCGLTFRKSFCLLTHIKSVHEKERNYKCDKCPMSFILKRALRQHMQVHDHSLRKYACGICKMRFRNKNKLQVHMNTHESACEFKCNFCETIFNQKTALTAHIGLVHDLEAAGKPSNASQQEVEEHSISIETNNI